MASERPQAQLRLAHVHGYRGHQCRSNVHASADGSIVYFVAGVGVVADGGSTGTEKQRFYFGHDDDIICMDMHESKEIVCTGQIGSGGRICVWQVATLETVSILNGPHSRGVASVRFGQQDRHRYLVSCGLEDAHTIVVWDWVKGIPRAQVSGHTDRVFDAQLSPFSSTRLVSCGVGHVKFWTLAGNTLTSSTGTLDGNVLDVQTQLAIAYDQPASETQQVYTASLNGSVFVWTEDAQLLRTVQCHKGPVFSLHSTPHGFATGGKDGYVRLWEPSFAAITEINIAQTSAGYDGVCIRSVLWEGECILVGTKDSEVLRLKGTDKLHPEVITEGHRLGELWGLACHPHEKQFATASDDGTVRMWSLDPHRCLASVEVNTPLRSCDFTEDGSALVVGGKNGTLFAFNAKDLQLLSHMQLGTQAINVVKTITSTENQLMVGCGDGTIVKVACGDQLTKVKQLRVSKNFVSHIDIVDNASKLLITDGEGRLLYVDVEELTMIPDERISSHAHTVDHLSTPMHASCAGVWGKYADANDVNGVAVASDHVVSGDDYGNVKLFSYPSPEEGAVHRTYKGHSAHVTNLQFDPTGSWLVTTGGSDHAVFVWSFHRDGGCSTEQYDSDDLESDYSDAELDEVDSDIEQEVRTSYERKEIPQASVKPSASKAVRAPPPLHSLRLDRVHGYRGYDCRDNMFYDDSLDVLVYHVAGVGIIMDMKTLEQQFYVAHTDDILCLCHHPADDLVATGQVGKDAVTHVWHMQTKETKSILKGFHTRGVCAVDFHPDGKRLISVGLDNDHSICLWNWVKGVKLASARGHKDKIFSIKFNSFDPNQFVTVGVKHIKFWSQKGASFTGKRGVFGKAGKQETMLSAVPGDEQTVYTGGASGSIYVWKGTQLQKVHKGHSAAVYCLAASESGFISGSKDGTVMVWAAEFSRVVKTFKIDQSTLSDGSILTVRKPAFRATALANGEIIAGTASGEILKIAADGSSKILAQGHGEGEVWGLCTHPSADLFATASDDKTIRLWSISENRLLRFRRLSQAARSAAISADGQKIVVGLKNGAVEVFPTDSFDTCIEPEFTVHHRKEDISDIKFSPDGSLVAVASHDNFVDIYNSDTWTRAGVCKSASSYITHVDWNTTGDLLMVNSGAKELLYFSAPKGKRQPVAKAALESLEWHTWTSVLGTTVSGIWPPSSDVTDVNAACLSRDKKILATADDFGFVKLFQYPTTGKHAKCKKYMGHSAHVTNVRFTAGDSHLISIGGGDTGIFVWAYGHGQEISQGGYSDDSDTDSEEDGYDSDVARETAIDYVSKTYNVAQRAKKGRTRKAPKRSARKPVTKRPDRFAAVRKPSTKPIKALHLEYVHGYRGFDARNNLRFVDPEVIVYPAAAVGVVMDISTGKQSFYREHTDDILCLATIPRARHLVATGQVGTEACIHVWNTQTLETVSMLSGTHKVGVGCLDFSANGKNLVSVDIASENPSVVVHRWQSGTVLATDTASHKRIFSVAFKPGSDVEFVTVGIKSITFWVLTGSSLVRTRGHTGDQKMTTMLGVAFGEDGTTFSAAMTGQIWVWKHAKLLRVVDAHSRPCFAMSTDVTKKSMHILTGGKDGRVKVWNTALKLQHEMEIPGEEIRSVARGTNSRWLVGTESSAIYMVTEGSKPQLIVRGHGEGELWGLAACTSDERRTFDFATASDDKTLRLWQFNPHKLVRTLNTGAPAHCVCFDPAYKFCYVGLGNGQVLVFDLDSPQAEPASKRDRGEMILTVSVSPNSGYLVTTSADGWIDFYELPSLKRVGYANNLPSAACHLDWSADSSVIKVETMCGQTLVLSSLTAKPAATSPLDVEWATWTGVLDVDTHGVWPKNTSDAGFVNCLAVSEGMTNCVTGDDFGFVKLFDFPCPGDQAPFKKSVGHSAHVTNATFAGHDKYVVTTGGDDACVFVWKTVV
eukprot:m.287561 g.287561  ORF g.287561 m.287561 type:complete len:1929 (-) comp15790_c5_seq3:4131-9917(-)